MARCDCDMEYSSLRVNMLEEKSHKKFLLPKRQLFVDYEQVSASVDGNELRIIVPVFYPDNPNRSFFSLIFVFDPTIQLKHLEVDSRKFLRGDLFDLDSPDSFIVLAHVEGEWNTLISVQIPIFEKLVYQLLRVAHPCYVIRLTFDLKPLKLLHFEILSRETDSVLDTYRFPADEGGTTEERPSFTSLTTAMTGEAICDRQVKVRLGRIILGICDDFKKRIAKTETTVKNYLKEEDDSFLPPPMYDERELFRTFKRLFIR